MSTPEKQINNFAGKLTATWMIWFLAMLSVYGSIHIHPDQSFGAAVALFFLMLVGALSVFLGLIATIQIVVEVNFPETR